jgi:hypothetical protein
MLGRSDISSERGARLQRSWVYATKVSEASLDAGAKAVRMKVEVMGRAMVSSCSIFS